MSYDDAVTLHIDTAAAELDNASPQAILRWAAHTFGDRLAVVTSFQNTGIVTLHMLQSIAPDTTVITLDTGLLFPETVQLIDRLEEEFNLNLIRARPGLSVEAQAEQYGDALWSHNPDHCCQMRKVQPLEAALRPFDAWVTGLRRDQSARRANTPTIGRDKKRPNMIKIAPFATWTADMVDLYIQTFGLPYNPLYDQGYRSIGCWPCTQPVRPDDDPRAGRWRDSAKNECGIHTDET
ncbi:MAG: phosphoadenylyl-sulfate reductase [Chloroflexota bacterium]